MRYFNGELQLAATDLAASGFSTPWSHRRVYSNQLSSSADVGNGYNWLVEDWPYLVQGNDGAITFVRGTRRSLRFTFDSRSGQYEGQYGAKSTLVHDSEAQQFVLTQPSGEQWKFHDFSQIDYPQGAFSSHLTPGNQAIEVTSYTSENRIGTVERSVMADGTATIEQFAYEYFPQGPLKTITLKRQENGGSWHNIRRAEYTYYGSEASYGSEGDLESVIRLEWNGSSWNSIGVSYYRYWLFGEPIGFQHGLKYVLSETNYARMVADGIDPYTAGDAQLMLYTDNYFEYDSQRRVTKEVVYGGSQTFTFSYTPSGHSDDYNHWKMKTVETLPDENQVTVYTNYIGQVILKELNSNGDRWMEYHAYDGDGHEILSAEPSAIDGYNESQPDLAVSLKANEGLIHLTEYYPLTGSSSSSSASGGPAGYKKAQNLQEGSSGIPILQKSWTYTSHSVGGNTIYPQATETVYRNDDGTGEIVTSYDYTWYSGTLQMQQITTTLPAVPTSQNGSGIAATRRVYLDEFGNATWSMDERGYITRLKYDIPTGAVTQRIDDVDTSIETDAPSGWVTPSDGGLNLITDYEHDNLGRITQTLGPWHTIDIDGTATEIRRASWTVYDETASSDITRTAQGYATGTASNYTYTLVNPVSIAIQAKNGKPLQQIQATRAGTSGKLLPSDTFAQASYTRWTTFQYTDCCNLASQRVYHTIPSSGEGSSGTNYDETSYGYDAMKRRNRNVTPGGTITRTVFDPRGLTLSTWVGTDDTGATASDPTGGGASGNNMVVISEYQYDDGNAGGNGNLTQQTNYANSTDTRVTTFLYDFRNRRTVIDGEIDLYQADTYDNLYRLVKTERYDTNSAGNLVGRRETKYDDRGDIYQSIQYGVDPSTGSVGNSLASNTWYDPAGNMIKLLRAGSKMFTKSVYDSLGRQTAQYQGYDLDETTYMDAGNVDGDTILEQSESQYDAASNLIQATTRQRYHNAPATQTGELKDPTNSPKARVTYRALYPDSLGRQQADANYGTNGGSALSRSSTIPSRSDSVLVNSQAYDDGGDMESMTDPAGMVTKMEYDAVGRQTANIMNYLPSSSSSSSSSSSGTCEASDDTNVTVRTTYNSDGNVSSITAENSATGDQTTQYVYGTTLSDSDIASSLLKRKEIYPDSVDGSDAILFSYNRQRQRTSVTDQNGTVHSYDYDALGRVTQDRVTTLGPDVDGAVRRIGMTYEVRGMRETLTSCDHPDVESGDVVNEVRFAYNEFGQLITDYQAHSGAVNTSTTPKVEYGYADGSANTIRPTTLTYPNGRVLTYDYGTANGIDDAASRVASLVDDDVASTHLVEYSYLGRGSSARSVDSPFGQGFVVADYTQPDTKWTLVDLSGANDPDTGDIYTGLDRFGRVKDNRWYDYGSSADVDRIKYGYDRAGNRIWRQNVVADALSQPFDELYGYDGVHRPKEMSRGTLNSQKDSITNKSLAECWSLDATGNWQKYLEDTNGDGTWDLNQARSANTVNEITDITESTGPSWVTPAYDRAGNMTTIPQPKELTCSYAAIYDAWNRLVSLADGANTVAEYKYDGAKRRLIVESYVSGSLSATRHAYFTDPTKWQVVEERVGTSSDAERQFLWGLRYIDDLTLRDRDTNGNGTLAERLYAMQDANWNLAALVGRAGDVRERFAYLPCGESQELNPDFTTYSGDNLEWVVRFTGREIDMNTGLQINRHRYLHLQLGKWISRDFIGYVDGPNLYALYQSLSSVDPSGLGFIYHGHYDIENVGPSNAPETELPDDDFAFGPGGAITGPPHNPGGPNEPPGKNSCKGSDTCATLSKKIKTFIAVIASHELWDKNNPDPRWPCGRHSDEIKDFRNGLQKCYGLYTSKCRKRKNPKPKPPRNPTPPSFPFPVLPIIVIPPWLDPDTLEPYPYA